MSSRGKPRGEAKSTELIDVQSTDATAELKSGSAHPADVVVGTERVINLQDAMNRLGGDRQLFDDMAGFFRADSPSYMREIQAGIEKRDASAVEFAAHTLKNMAATCGGEQTARLAGKIEICGRQEDLEGAAEFLPTLAGAVQALDDALDKEVSRS